MFETSVLFNNIGQPEPSEVKENWWSWHKIRPWILPLLITSGVGCVAVGMWLFFKPTYKPLAQDTVLINLDTSSNALYIDVSGAVASPGVYQVEDGKRVSDAIDAAGGLDVLADMEYLNSTLNLSARLKDEQKIYIPFVGEKTNVNKIATHDSLQFGETSEKADSLISINNATETELDTLPRIGPATAQKVIEGRPYSSIEELVAKKVVAESVLTEIQSLIKL